MITRILSSYNPVKIHRIFIFHRAFTISAQLWFSLLRHRRLDIDRWHASVLPIVRLFIFQVVYQRTAPWTTSLYALAVPSLQGRCCSGIDDRLWDYPLIAHLLTRHIAGIFLDFGSHRLLRRSQTVAVVFGNILVSFYLINLLLLLWLLAAVLLQTTYIDHRRYIISIVYFNQPQSLVVRM